MNPADLNPCMTFVSVGPVYYTLKRGPTGLNYLLINMHVSLTPELMIRPWVLLIQKANKQLFFSYPEI